MIRCPEDEIGRDSVRPWTIPRRRASSSDIRRGILGDRTESSPKGALALGRLRYVARDATRRFVSSSAPTAPRPPHAAGACARGHRGGWGRDLRAHRRLGSHLLRLRADRVLRDPGDGPLPDPDSPRKPQAEAHRGPRAPRKSLTPALYGAGRGRWRRQSATAP